MSVPVKGITKDTKTAFALGNLLSWDCDCDVAHIAQHDTPARAFLFFLSSFWRERRMQSAHEKQIRTEDGMDRGLAFKVCIPIMKESNVQKGQPRGDFREHTWRLVEATSEGS